MPLARLCIDFGIKVMATLNGIMTKLKGDVLGALRIIAPF
jgi:hypothetical protein